MATSEECPVCLQQVRIERVDGEVRFVQHKSRGTVCRGSGAPVPEETFDDGFLSLADIVDETVDDVEPDVEEDPDDYGDD